MAMDVKREGVAKKKMIKRIIYLTLTAGAVAVISWRLSLLKPAAPTVERATVWIDQVKRGPMLRFCVRPMSTACSTVSGKFQLTVST